MECDRYGSWDVWACRSEAIEICDVVDLGCDPSEPTKSVALRGLAEKPSPTGAPTNLSLLSRYIPLQSGGFAWVNRCEGWRWDAIGWCAG